MTYVTDIPLKIDAEKWYHFAESLSDDKWPKNERTRYFHSRYVPTELRDDLLAQFKIPFDIATFHKHYPLEDYMWHKDVDRQTVVICQISPDNTNIYLEISDESGIKRFDYSRGKAIILNGQVLHRVVNLETTKNRYIVTMGWHKRHDDMQYHSYDRLVSLFEIGEFIYG